MPNKKTVKRNKRNSKRSKRSRSRKGGFFGFFDDKHNGLSFSDYNNHTPHESYNINNLY